MVRVWGGDLANTKCYCFDFIKSERQYILTPDDVKIYSMETPFIPSIEILSMEEWMEQQKATSLYIHPTRRDPNWETDLRIIRTPHDSNMVLGSHIWN